MINLVVVDLYHGDRVESFAAAAASGIRGIIHKASQGADEVDPLYAERRSAALAAGLRWGAYHFGTGAEVDAQVANFLAAAQPDAGTLVALDYEPNGPDTMTLLQARAFLVGIAARLGRRPVLYSGSLINWATRTMPSSARTACGSPNMARSRGRNEAGAAPGCGSIPATA
jgi:GH25 family lysozyme M1 (1,4-beta-N-acetylmuramidase)